MKSYESEIESVSTHISLISFYDLNGVYYGRIKRSPAALKTADLILENYDVKNAKDINEALKDVFGPLFERLLNVQMDAHLGYDKNSQEEKEHENRRNGFSEKTIQGSFGETKIAVPRD